MNMPGFTAEASISRGRVYAGVWSQSPVGVLPSVSRVDFDRRTRTWSCVDGIGSTEPCNCTYYAGGLYASCNKCFRCYDPSDGDTTIIENVS
jgi:hypothetical protein